MKRKNPQDWAAQWAIYRPNKLAFKEAETGDTLTYSELNHLANRLTHHFRNTYDLQKGDRIAILAENSWLYWLLFSTAQKAGWILVPINYRLATSELDYLLGNAEPRLLICESLFEEKVKAASIFPQLPHYLSLQQLRCLCDKQKQQAEDATVTYAKIDEDDPIFILYTSGTTGFPKGALYTHKMLFWNSINTSISLIVNTESCTVNCMPPFHTGGWNVLGTPFLHHGAYTCLMKKFDAEKVLKLIEQEQATVFMGVPTMLKMIADLPAFETADFSSLSYIIVGGEPMSIPLIEKWQAKGVPIRQGYGMTEVGPNLTSLHQDDAVRKKGSIGRPNFYVQTKIVDTQGKECPVGTAGELLLRGPMVTTGYWQNEGATAKAFQGDWFKTGDQVKLDEEGYLYVVDRIKNMYISGGENVYPAEVERVLLAHSAVAEAAVIGVADDKWGETGKAFIVLQAAAQAEDLIDFCKKHLAKFKVPRTVVFLEELPKNDTGKIDRKGLVKLHESS